MIEKLKLAVEYYKESNFSKAKSIAEEVIANDPKNAIAWKILGVVNGLLGFELEEREAKEKSVQLSPSDPEAHTNLANCLKKIGELERAEEHYRAAVSLKPDLISALNNLGIILKDQSRFLEASVYYKKLLQIEPTNQIHAENYSSLLIESCNFEEAKNFCLDAINKWKASHVLLANYGTAQLNLDSPNEAKAFYLRSVELNSEYESALVNLGVVESKLGNWEGAIGYFKRVLEINPNNIDSCLNLGFAYQTLGKEDDAKKNFLKCVEINNKETRALVGLGDLSLVEKNYTSALNYFKKAIKFAPTSAKAIHGLARYYKELGNTKKALIWYKKALKLEPNDPLSIFNYCNQLVEIGKLDEANELLHKSIEQLPKQPLLYSALGHICQLQNNYIESEEYYKISINLGGNSLDLLCNYGALLQKTKSHERAIKLFESGLKKYPTSAVLYSNLGLSLKALKEYEKSIASFEKAIQLDPNLADAYNNFGALLHTTGNFEKAILLYAEAIKIKPDSQEFKLNLSCSLQDNGNYVDAISLNKKIIEQDQNYIEAKWNLSIKLLKHGDLIEGFKLYETRWVWKDFSSPKRHFSKPLWLGQSSVEEKIILVHWEQGFGDTIQFVRYIPLLESLGAKVLFACQKPLVKLFMASGFNCKFVDIDNLVDDFDFHIPLLSLPHAFKTEINTIPKSIPYLRTPDTIPSRLKIQRLRKASIGLVWSGNPTHGNDHNRSFKPEELADLITMPFDFHCLQRDLSKTDLDFISEHENLTEYSRLLNDYYDTACLVSQLDAVVCVDTSVAHLSAAMGKDVFLILGISPDWRWFNDIDFSPWYPTVKIYRKDVLKSNSEIFKRLRQDLIEKYGF